LRVALRDPNEKEIQSVQDHRSAYSAAGPGESAHLKTTFDNADETATSRCRSSDSGAFLPLRRAIQAQRFPPKKN